jgi:hypothetical protein
MKDSVAVDIDFSREARRFFAIQIGRYLLSKNSGRFSGLPEKDAVMGMIKDTWIELRSTGILDNLSREGREAVYLTTIIVFPSFVADAGLQCVPVDFITGKTHRRADHRRSLTSQSLVGSMGSGSKRLINSGVFADCVISTQREPF